jgi:HrpA-like RNA helicase
MYAFGQYIAELREDPHLASLLIDEHQPRCAQHLVTVVAQDPAETNDVPRERYCTAVVRPRRKRDARFQLDGTFVLMNYP